MEQLKNKIKKEELYDTLQTKKKLNKEEGEYLEQKINQIDPGFEKRIAQDKEAEAEKDKKLKLSQSGGEEAFNNIQPKKSRQNTLNSKEDKKSKKSSKKDSLGENNKEEIKSIKSLKSNKSKKSNKEENKSVKSKKNNKSSQCAGIYQRCY